MVPRSRISAAAASTTSSDSRTTRLAPSTEISWRSGEEGALGLVVGRAAGRLHPEDVEVGAEALGRAPGAAHEPLRAGLRLHERQQPLADRGRRAHLGRGDPLGDDLLGDLAQRGLAQRGQVLDPEEAVERGVDALGGIDLALAQALEQRLGRDIDQHDLVRALQRLVGQRLAHPHAAVLGELVVERLQVLHVERREDVDAGREHVLDVLEALAVLEARRVGVGELVDQAQPRRSRQDRRQVHLGHGRAAIDDLAPRDDLEALSERRGLGAPVGLEQADHGVTRVGAPSWSIR